MSAKILISAVGDTQVALAEPESSFDLVADALDAADVLFGNSEGAYSETSERNPSSWAWEVVHPRGVPVLASAGFDVMSVANNHVMDGGYSGLADTMRHLRDAGVKPVGGGQDLAEARKLVVVERHGRRVGFLAYTCVYPPGFEARTSRPGCATILIHSIFRTEQNQPGTQPVVWTVADPEGKAAVLADVRAARDAVDILIVGMHWGVHCLPAVLTDYERELGHALIDAGADAVFGCHQHILKGIELHAGKPIFYGLGNFLMGAGMVDRVEQSPYAAEAMAPFIHFYGDYLIDEWHPEARRSMIARCAFDEDGSVEPVMLRQQDPRPAVIAADDPEFQIHLDYLRDITRRASLNARFEPHDGVFRVTG
jgi:hypothetical protein